MSSRIAVTEDGLVQASPLDRTYIGGHAKRNGHSTYASGPAAAAVDAVGDEYYCVEAREAPHAEVIGVRAEERYSCCSRIRCIVTWLWKCVITTWAHWAVFYVGGVFVWIASYFVIWFMFGVDFYDTSKWAAFITLVYLLLVTGYFFFDVYETGCFGLYEKERRQDGQDSASANASAGANSTNRSKLARFLLACRCCGRVWVYIFAFWVGSVFFFSVFLLIFRLTFGGDGNEVSYYAIIPTAIYDCCLLYYLYKESKSTGCFGLRDPNQPDIEMQAGATVGNRDNGQMVVVDATPVHATAIITVTAPAPVPTATLRIPSFNP